MDFTVTVADNHRRTALQRAVQAYSERNGSISEAELVQRIVNGAVDGFVANYLTTKISHVAFLKRFTQEERVAIRAAAQAVPEIDDYLEMLKAAGADVDLTDPITAQGLQALEAAGLLDEGRAAEILAL